MNNSNSNMKIPRPFTETNWILRYGQYIIVFIFLIAILITTFFSFNELIKGKVRVTSKFPPAEITAKQHGKLSTINFQHGDTVGKGAVLGIIENSADYNHIQYLKGQIILSKSFQSLDSLSLVFPSHLRLGITIQPFYQIFNNTYRELILDDLMKEDVFIQGQISEQLISQKRFADKKNQEFSLAQKALQLQGENLARHEKLFNKGVIAQQELEKIENEFLISKQKLELITQQIEQLNIETIGMKRDKKLVSNAHFKNSNLLEVRLETARQDLLNKILEWEENFLLISPFEGTISYNEVWGKFQSVDKGELVFVVVPFNNNNLIGRCKIPIRNSGKIIKGQTAYLKIENYPYREWGMVKAEVESFSNIPGLDNEEYLVFLKIDNLTTSYGKKLEFNRELIGEAEIILEETTIIERIFYQFRHLWSIKEY